MVKYRYWKIMHMFDMEIPKTIEEAHELYEESDTDY